MINVVVSLYYYIQVVKAAFLLEPDEELPPIHLSRDHPHCGDGCRHRRGGHLAEPPLRVGSGRRANTPVAGE